MSSNSELGAWCLVISHAGSFQSWTTPISDFKEHFALSSEGALLMFDLMICLKNRCNYESRKLYFLRKRKDTLQRDLVTCSYLPRINLAVSSIVASFFIGSSHGTVRKSDGVRRKIPSVLCLKGKRLEHVRSVYFPCRRPELSPQHCLGIRVALAVILEIPPKYYQRGQGLSQGVTGCL